MMTMCAEAGAAATSPAVSPWRSTWSCRHQPPPCSPGTGRSLWPLKVTTSTPPGPGGRGRGCDGRAGPAGGGVRPEQRLLGSDSGRLADAPQAFGRVAARQRPGPPGVPRVREDIGPDMHGRRPGASRPGHRSTVRAGTWSGGLSPLGPGSAIEGSGKLPSLSFAWVTARTCTGAFSLSWTWASPVVRKR